MEEKYNESRIANMINEVKRFEAFFNFKRIIILAISVLSLLNLLLIAFYPEFHTYFGLVTPMVVLKFCTNFVWKGNTIATTIGLIFGSLVPLLFFALYIMSKNHSLPVTIAIILFITDILLLIIVIFMDLSDAFNYIYTIVFHVLTGILLFDLKMQDEQLKIMYMCLDDEMSQIE